MKRHRNDIAVGRTKRSAVPAQSIASKVERHSRDWHDRLRRTLFVCCAIGLATSVRAAEFPNVKVTNVRRVFHNGEHNAFTDMVRWQGKFWLTFRSCPDGHPVHPTASVIVLSSTDTKEWNQVHRFSVPKRDTRDPHFLVFNDKLFVYTGTWYCGDHSPTRSEYTLNRHLGYAAWSADGKDWHSPIMLEGTFGHYIWRAATYGGRAFLCGRRNKEFDMSAIGEGALVESAMLESDDGLIWRKRTLFQEERGDETAFLFEPDGSVLAVGRRGGAPAELLKSKPPYTEWERRDFDRYIGGPLITRWSDRIIVGGRKSGAAFVGNRGPKTALYWLNPNAKTEQGLLTEFAELPSGGDTSYPGFVELDPTHAVVSWYSSHEKDADNKTTTAIYLADLEIE